mgnify:CR=1 FL=1
MRRDKHAAIISRVMTGLFPSRKWETTHQGVGLFPHLQRTEGRRDREKNALGAESPAEKSSRSVRRKGSRATGLDHHRAVYGGRDRIGQLEDMRQGIDIQGRVLGPQRRELDLKLL